MDGFRDELRRMLDVFSMMHETCNKELVNYPVERLQCLCRNGNLNYFKVETIDGKQLRKGITKDKTQIRMLARRKYLEELDSRILNNYKWIKKAFDHYESLDSDQIKMKMPNAIRSLPEEFYVKPVQSSSAKARGSNIETASKADSGIFIPESLKQAARNGMLTKTQVSEIREIQREWAAQPYEINTKFLNQKNVVTSRGLKVRSKSEGMIAEWLYKYDIPFRHDQVIQMGQKRVSPDFTFFSIINGEQYWEHVGRTNDEDYNGYHSYKLKLYESVGITPWHNYIETYDEADGYFDNRIIEAEIENKLLRRLQLQ